MRRTFTISVVLLAFAAPSIARAQDGAACKDGYDRSQVLRDGGKLLEAQKLLRLCASASCSAFVQKECAGWLADMDARIPSVILSAKDGGGADLVDVAVSIDGQDGPRKLDGRPLDIDPGEHTFVFQVDDGTKAEQHVLVREREKGRTVAVVIGAPPEPPPPPPMGRSASGEPGSPPSAERPPASGGTSPLKIAGVAVGGAGLLSLAVGTIFGLKASAKLDAPQCDTSAKVCDPGVIDDAKSAATVSTIGFVAGGVLVAGGVTMVLLAPSGGSRARSPEAKGARLSAAPMIGASSSGLWLHGAW